MVSASKMKGDLYRLEHGKDFGHQSVDMIFKCDTYMQRKAPPESSEQQQLIVPVTSDRGLCGGINSGIIREIKTYITEQGRENIELFVIGEKGTAGCMRPFPDLLKESAQGLSTPVNFAQTMALTQKIITHSEKKDKVVIYYNEFKSALVQYVRRIELMSKSRFLESMRFQKLYELKLPDGWTSNPAMYELYVASNLFMARLQNAASEQSARMNAMENASSNAGDIIDALQLEYNKARQARITSELVEIISGASAV